MNEIEIYKGNTQNIIVDVSGLTDLIGYIPYLTVKPEFNETAVITKTGSVNGLACTFALTNTDTSIVAGDYYYDVVIDNSINKYTVLQDLFQIVDSIKFH